MNGAKRSAEAVGCKKNASVGERSALEESTRASRCGRSGSENVGLSNANIGENPMPRKPKGSSARVRRGRENASSQCPSTRRYGAEVTHAILPGKARTTFNKRVPVPETDTERPYEALLFPGIGFGPFPAQLRWKAKKASLGGSEPSVRYHSGRARILTLCQDLRAKGQSQVTEACKGFLGPDGDWPSSAKAEGSLTARPTRRAGTKVGLSDPTVPSGRAVAQRIKVTLGITG
ncbi:hypothetical protein H6P81_021346 [Aristolochia fimbriata]|uniref:Uncharacterized protein n=1 Tax=Aristolochia fimbriata TaxID=158543 RepID=A0AAV7DRT5_ARIFI|nr:hypothetical protein H6P81_021346 [Aristolochia fimbriata]